MQWYEQYGSNTRPTYVQVKDFINTELWDELCRHMAEAYKAAQVMDYSGCSAQPGWNIKYKKSGRSLCTLYPMPGCFVALVVVGAKEQPQTEFLLPSLTAYTQELYARVPFSAGGRWLMLEVRNEAVLADVKALIQIRATAKK